MDASERNQPDLGRRDVIKKAAVAGAVVWSAPIILSSTAGASDPSGTCPPKDCKKTYFVRFDTSCQGDLPGGGGHDECRAAISAAYPALPPSGCSKVRFSSSGSTISMKLAPGFSVQNFWIKEGTGCFTGNCGSYTGKCGTSSGFEYGDEYVINTAACTGRGFSNLYAVICGPS